MFRKGCDDKNADIRLQHFPSQKCSYTYAPDQYPTELEIEKPITDISWTQVRTLGPLALLFVG